MDIRSGRQRTNPWFAAALITAAPLLIPLCWAMWRAPYPINETVALLRLGGVMGDANASSHSGIDPVLRDIFNPTARSWYRPFYHLTWYTFWRATGSLNATLLLFKALEVTAVASLIVLLLWRFRPKTFLEYAAATFAVAVLVGMPGFRENLEIPLLMTLVAMPLALVVWMLLEHDRRAWHGPVIVFLTVIAIGYKEQGLVIVPLIVAGWWTAAPGASRTTTAVITVMVLAYLAFRFSTAAAWTPFEQDVGLGFGMLSKAEAIERFGAFPLWIYAYNAACTVANILFSEPISGTFQIVRDVVSGQWLPWEINHLVSSTALTGLVAWWGISTWKREAGGPWSVESRIFAATVLAVAASGALGFNYSRDRLGGMAVPFYAMAAYFAVRAAGERALRASRGHMTAVAVALLLLACAWQIRAIGTVDSVHLMAAKVHREWLTHLNQRRTAFAGQTTYLRILEAMAGQGLEPGPPPSPPWMDPWLGER